MDYNELLPLRGTLVIRVGSQVVLTWTESNRAKQFRKYDIRLKKVLGEGLISLLYSSYK